MSVDLVSAERMKYVRDKLGVNKNVIFNNRGSFSNAEFPALCTKSFDKVKTFSTGSQSQDSVTGSIITNTDAESSSSVYLLAKGCKSPDEDQFVVIFSKKEKRRMKKLREMKQLEETKIELCEKKKMEKERMEKEKRDEIEHGVSKIYPQGPLPQRKCGRLRKRPAVKEKEAEVAKIKSKIMHVQGKSFQYMDQLRTDLKQSIKALRASKRMGGWFYVNPMGGLKGGAPELDQTKRGANLVKRSREHQHSPSLSPSKAAAGNIASLQKVSLPLPSKKKRVDNSAPDTSKKSEIVLEDSKESISFTTREEVTIVETVSDKSKQCKRARSKSKEPKSYNTIGEEVINVRTMSDKANRVERMDNYVAQWGFGGMRKSTTAVLFPSKQDPSCCSPVGERAYQDQGGNCKAALEAAQNTEPKLEPESDFEAEGADLEKCDYGDVSGEEVNDSVGPEPVFITGSVSYVVYLGSSACRDWDHSKLRTTFWVLNVDTIIMLRAMVDVSIKRVFTFFVDYLKLHNHVLGVDAPHSPIFSLMGKKWDPKEDSLFSLKEGTTILIFDKDVPEEYKSHQGWLWQCKRCMESRTAKKNLDRVHCRDSKGRKHPHTLFFHQFLSSRTQWGSKLDKHSKPYGCPKNHDGVGPKYTEQTKKTEDKTRDDMIPTTPRRAANSRTPVTPTTPKSPFSENVEARFKRVSSDEKIYAKMALHFSPKTMKKSPQRPSNLLNRLPQSPLRSRARKIVNYVETKHDSDPDDLSSDENSEEEFKPKSEDDRKSDHEINEDGPLKTKVKKGHPYPMTDGESDEDEEVERVRRKCRATVRSVMHSRQEGEASAWEYPHLWVPTEREKEMINQFIARPAMMQGGKYQNSKFEAPHWVKEMVERGEVPTGSTKEAWNWIAKSAVDYIRGFKVFVGQWQKQMQESSIQREKLVDGHLPLTRLLDYFSPRQILFPEKIRELISGIRSPDTRMHAFLGIEHFLKSLVEWLSGQEAIDLFEVNGATRDERVKEKAFFQSVIDQMKNGKPYQEFRGDKAWFKKQKDKYQTEHVGNRQLDSSDITKFLDSQCTIDHISDLIYWAKTSGVPNDSQFVKLTDGNLQRIHLLSGMRKEVWTVFSYSDYSLLRNGKDASRPFFSVDPNTIDVKAAEEQGRVMTSGWGTNVYVRDDLHNPDPNVRNDPINNDQLCDEDRDLLLGKYTVVKNHKTGTKYEAIIWLSKFQLAMCDLYEEIRAKFILSKGQDPTKGDRAFFINSKCEPFITTYSKGFDWSDLELLTGCGRFTSHMARHIMSDFVSKQENQLLKEGRQYLMCNNDETDRRFYQLDLRHTDLAINLRAEYEESMKLNQNLVVGNGSNMTFVSQAQKERQLKALKSMKDQEKGDYLKLERELYNRARQSKERLLTQNDRTALIQCIIASRSSALPVTKHGDLVELFLTGKACRGSKHAKILLRLLYILPPSMECVQRLHDCLILFAEFSRDETSLRKIEWDFALKLLMVFNNLSKASTFGNQNLVQCFVKINRNLGDDQRGYFCGNPLLCERVGKIISQEKSLEAVVTGDGSIVSDVYLKQFQDDMLNRFKLAKKHDESKSEIDQENVKQNFKDHVGKFVWSDECKVLLLEAYIKHATEPLSRPKDRFGKAEYIHNLKRMRNADVCILLPGDEVPTRLSSLSSSADTLAQFFYPKGKGLKKQGREGGLAQIIDNWMEKQQVQTIKHLRENIQCVVDSCYPL